MERCPWCEGFDLYRDYHDFEWGVPLHDERALFELLILEGAHRLHRTRRPCQVQSLRPSRQRRGKR